jgi:protein-disulfide isomerase
MSGDSKFFLGVLGVALLAVVGFFVFGKSAGGETVTVDTTVGHKLGSDNAKVKIVEFGDFQCPACRAAAGPLKEVYEKNKENVQLIYRHIPLASHRNADESAQAAEAAAKQGKFWEMYELLFAKQDEWSNLPDPLGQFETYALALDLEVDKFGSDYRSEEVAANIQNDKKAASQYGVNSTPTFFVNGEKVTGALSTANWQQIIDRKISELESESQ